MVSIKEKVKSLIKECIHASDQLRFTLDKIRLISHYDADGICSASILSKALAREGKDFHISLIKQLNQAYIEELSKERNSFIVFTDLGSGSLNEIQEKLCSKGCSVIILDHHEVQGEIKDEYRNVIYHINPLDYGIEENISGSGVSYIFARSMNPENRELAFLGIIGALGDSQAGAIGEKWGLMGLNKEILKDAIDSKKIKKLKGLRIWGRNTRPLHKALEYSIDPYIPGVSGSQAGAIHFLQEIGIDPKNGNGWKTLSTLTKEETQKLSGAIIAERVHNGESNPEWIFGDIYELTGRSGEFSDASEFATMLNACGKVGNGFVGLDFCLNGHCETEIGKILKSYRTEIGKALSLVEKKKEMITETENAVFIDARGKISEHIISNVTSILTKSNILPQKPVFAFSHTEDGLIKVSCRLPASLEGKGIDMKEIIVKIVERLGGEGGGHSGAAGAFIPADAIESFISESQNLIEISKEPKTKKMPEKPEERQAETPRKEPLGQKDKRIVEHSVSEESLKTNRKAENEIKVSKESVSIIDEAQNNLNTTEQLTDIQTNGDYNGSTESKGTKTKGREAEGKQADRTEDRREKNGSQEMEREGLVRYFHS